MFQQEKELTLSFDRVELIEKIKAAKKKHLTDLESSREKFLDRSIKMLEKALAVAKTKKGNGKANKRDEDCAMRAFAEISALNVKTESHEKEYDEIIEMLGAAKNVTVLLGASVYRQFVQGQWHPVFGGLSSYMGSNPYPLGINSPIVENQTTQSKTEEAA